MKKYEIAYHYYAEAKRASSAKIIYSNPASDDIVRSVKTTAYDQKIYICVIHQPRSVRIGKNCARGLGYTRQRVFFPNTDRPWLVNNIFYFFLKPNKWLRKEPE